MQLVFGTPAMMPSLQSPTNGRLKAEHPLGQLIRLKALSEMQAILRNTSVGLDWEDPISVPAGDLMLVIQMALQRLG